MIKSCKTMDDFHQLLANSHEKPVFLFKHSTRCPISASRWQVFQGFADSDQTEYWRVLVIEDRPTSLQIARESNVAHQSPQAILFHNSQAAWHASHYSITAEEMTKALNQATPRG